MPVDEATDQSGLPQGSFNAQTGSVYEPTSKDSQDSQDKVVSPVDAPKAPDPKPPALDTTGFGPLEGTRWLKTQAGYQFASMSMMSDNPGFYVRQQQDLMKKIDGFGQNLSMDDAKHVWEQTFMPRFNELNVKRVQDEYDARGKALLDQIYAPMGHGDTKPKWDQIPKSEREAAVAYAVVSLFTGKGGLGRAITALDRPLTLQEQENQKKEAERQQNEELRRQGLVQQFNMLLGNEKQDVANLQQSQREDAAARKQELTIQGQEERQNKTIQEARDKDYEAGVRGIMNKYTGLLGNKATPSATRKALLAQMQQDRQELDDRFGKTTKWEPSPELKAQANEKTAYEQMQDARLDEYKKEAPLKFDALKLKNKLAGVNIDTAKYKYDNILPWQAKSAQEHYYIQGLTVDKLNAAKLNGWVTNARGGTILKDANGQPITDAAGNVIRTVGEARMKLSDMEAVAKTEYGKISGDMALAGLNPDQQKALAGQTRLMLENGMKAGEVESMMSSTVEGVLGVKPDLTLVKRLVANQMLDRDNEQLRRKLGTSTVDHQTVPGQSNTPPPTAQQGATWTRPSDNSRWTFTQGPKGLGWYKAK